MTEKERMLSGKLYKADDPVAATEKLMAQIG